MTKLRAFKHFIHLVILKVLASHFYDHLIAFKVTFCCYEMIREKASMRELDLSKFFFFFFCQ